MVQPERDIDAVSQGPVSQGIVSQGSVAALAASRIAATSLQFEALIDWNHLHQLADGNTEFEIELLQLFTTDSLAQLLALQEAIATQSCSTIEKIAHYLKGSSANVGAQQIRYLCEQIELAARRQQLESLTPAISALEAALQRLSDYMQYLQAPA